FALEPARDETLEPCGRVGCKLAAGSRDIRFMREPSGVAEKKPRIELRRLYSNLPEQRCCLNESFLQGAPFSLYPMGRGSGGGGCGWRGLEPRRPPSSPRLPPAGGGR